MSGLRHFSRRRQVRSLRRRQLLLEPLEDRRVLSVFTVDSPGDEPDWIPGDGKAETVHHETTLRAAIMEANASVGKDTIEFNIPGAGPHVIKPATRLPAIIDPISIDGYSQPGASPTSMTLGQGNNAVIKIELDGSLLPIGTNGLEIFGGQSEVRGLAIHSFYGRPITHQEFLGTTIVAENGMGIWLWAGGNSQIVGNFLGATASGQVPTYPLPAGTATAGIMVGSYDNVIQENLVVGNHGPGVVLGSRYGDVLATKVYGNKVYGNYVGMQQNGQTPLPNDTGVLICWGAHDNEIGGGSANFGNLISGNSGTGVSLVGVGLNDTYYGGNIVQRNLIGTDRTGKLIDPDQKPKTGDETGNRHVGIQIDRSPGNVIGGESADAGNVISGNQSGVLVVEPQSAGNVIRHNKIGTDADGTTALPNDINGIDIHDAPRNTIKSNLISGNASSGIYLEGAGATANLIETNLIGTDATGAKALGNQFGGIDIVKASENIVFRNTISGSPNYGIGVTILGAEAQKNRIAENRIGTDAAGQKDLGNAGAGVAIAGGSENVVHGNIISGNDYGGIWIQGATAKRNDVYGNYIGTDVTGTLSLKNGRDGICIQDASENWIGGFDPTARNIIAGNDRDGIRISGKTAKGNRVSGNYIGTDATGMKPLPNSGVGVYVDNAPENVIGGVTSDRRNVIASNLGGGVTIVGAEAVRNAIQGNYIGTNKDGAGTDLGNASDGVLIDRAAEVTIGGTTSKPGDAPGNIIAGNWQAGVHIQGSTSIDIKVQGNVIGRSAADGVLGNVTHGVFIENARQTIIGEPTTTGAPAASTGNANVISGNTGDGVRISGKTATGNLVRRNAIYDNQRLGINLVGGQETARTARDGVTPNDWRAGATGPIDADEGPNHLLNFPVGVTAWHDASTNKTHISGVLSTAMPELFVVDLYANTSVDPSGCGEGRHYLGSTVPKEDGTFALVIAGVLPAPFVSATTVDPDRSTSEFSPAYGDLGRGDGIVDTDGDGLPDEWEVNGLDFNGDGRADLPLHQAPYNADFRQKDIFLEVDYMERPGRTLRPDVFFEVDLNTAFQLAPVGATGISLHVDVDEPVPYVNGITFDVRRPGPQNDFDDFKLGEPANPTGIGNNDAHFGTRAERSLRSQSSDAPAAFRIGAKALVYHYCLFVHDLLEQNVAGNFVSMNAGGIAEPFGNDFVVVVGSQSSIIKPPGPRTLTGELRYEVATTMHELGHNLGLGHGGPWPRTTWQAWENDLQSNTNYKPNFLSIMNYSFQFTDWVADRPLDYSRWTLPTLNESALNEKIGLSPPADPTFATTWRHTVYTVNDNWTSYRTASTAGKINWDNDANDNEIVVVAGINDHDPNPPNPRPPVPKNEILVGAEEWSQLFYGFRASPQMAAGVHGAMTPQSPEMSREHVREIAAQIDFDGDGFPNGLDNAPAIYNPDQADGDGDGVGDAGELSGLTVSRTAAVGGDVLVGTITLLLPAPADGTFVRLYSSDWSVATVPREVEIPAGTRSATFAITTSPLTRAITPVTILADFFQQYLTAELTVTPAPAAADLSLLLTAAPDPVGLGGVVTHTLEVTNRGPEPVTGVTLTDVLPVGAILKTATGTVSERVPGPGLRVRFDYTYDANNFFDTQEKKDLLQLAGDILMSAMGDELAAIVPGAGDTWTAIFEHPATGAEVRLTDLEVPANEIIVYVGARDLGDTGTGVMEGALAGPGSLAAAGSVDFNRLVTTRGQRGAAGPVPTDFGAWGGTITFNTNPAVTFSYDDEVEAGVFDFFTVALHEMMHVLGLGTSGSWETHVDAVQGVFTGPTSQVAYDAGGNVPLDPGALGHWREGITEAGEPVLMDPLLPNALRIWYPTALDWAGLTDVGWNTDGLLTVERPIVFTEMAGSVIGDIGVLEPGQSVTITLEVQPTLAGAMHNVATVTGYCDDPDLNNNRAETFGTVTALALIVNTTDDVDDGVVDATHTSLREAINAANSAPGVNTISFNIPGPGPHTIQPTSPLPVITDPVIIDGTTESDYAGAPVIELSGALAGPGNGLTITAGGSTVRGLVINRFQSDGLLETGNAILLKQGDGSTIEGCYLGTDTSGTLALGNEGAGVLVLESDDNTIGGTSQNAGNVLSGNTEWGIFLGPGVIGNEIVGNLIGTDSGGNAALGNGQAGIELHRATSNLIGGRTPEARNVISGNNVGITVKNFTGLGGTTNRIEGNYIGTNAAGDAALGNGTGILIHEFLATFAGRDTIGGAAAGAGNVISGNVGTGIQVMGTASIHVPDETYPIRGNLIGVAADAVTPLGNGGDGILVVAGASTGVFGGGANIGGPQPGAGNIIAYNGGHGVHLSEVLFPRVRGNSIFSNGGLGIEYVFSAPPPGSVTAPLPPGVNPQRPGIDHTIVDFPNAPVLSHAFTGAGSTTIEGTLFSYHVPENVFIVNPLRWTLDFYASPEADPLGFGEGQIYLGSLDDVYAMGTRTFSAVLPVEVPAGYVVSATATGSFYDNTSEFSKCVPVEADTDGDGVLDVVEDAGPNGGDANGDGTLDRLQNIFASLPNSGDDQYVVLEAEPGSVLRDVRALENPSPYDMPPGVSFPFGFFSYAGDSGPVRFHLPVSATIGTVYNFGRTADRPFVHWYQVPANEVDIDPNSFVLHENATRSAIGPAAIEAGAGTTIVVNSVDDNDDGQPENEHMTLREAINRANFLPGRETITFNIPGAGPHTVQPRSPLPTITDTVVIDGYTQPGALPATFEEPATIMIELDGSLAGIGINGLNVDADHSTLRGLCVNRFLSERYGWYGGIQINITGDGAVVEGNYIGVDPSGTLAYWEPGQYDYSQSRGVSISSTDNVIGGAAPAARNIVSGFTSSGIDAEVSVFQPGAAGSRVMGNYVGTDATGTLALGNGIGVLLRSSGVVIGGIDPGAGNLISGNIFTGIQINAEFGGGEGNVVQGNLIGTDVTGTISLGNGTAFESEGGAGIIVLEAANNVIGGTAPGARNVISGNNGEGIWIRPIEGYSLANVIQGNLIGTDVHGAGALGNTGNGVRIEVALDCIVGGTAPGAGNVIAYNGGHGVVVIGQLGEHHPTLGNSILANSIFSNGGLGIDLGGNGVTDNDPADGAFSPDPEVLELTIEPQGGFQLVTLTVEGRPNWSYSAQVYFVGGWYPNWYEVITDGTGIGQVMFYIDQSSEIDHIELVDLGEYLAANEFQNYPEITAVTLGAGTTIEGLLDSTPDTTFRIEFFDNTEADDSAYGEGRTFLSTLNVTTDASGIASFTLTMPELVPLDHFLTATATDADGNTSEFSLAVAPRADNWDFGDALGPAFPTLLASDGARHVLGSLLCLGSSVDADEDGHPSGFADGDDELDADDEDGVRFLSPLMPGHWAAVEVLASDQGRLDAWFDFAGNGTWAETEDRVYDGVTLLPGPNTLFFQVPATATADTMVFARFRFSSAGGLGYDGPAVDGEVEDYLVAIVAPPTGNQPPAAADDDATTAASAPIAIDVTANDVDPEGQLDPRTVTVTALPTSGRVYVDPATGVITYLPSAGFAGDDTFAYRVRDSEGLSDTARVTVHVLAGNRPPVAVRDTATTDEDVLVVIHVLANDSDPDNDLDPTSVIIVAPPAHGYVQVDAQSGAVIYTPMSDYHGADHFVYGVSDAQGATARALVEISVQPVSDPPLATDDFAQTDQDVSVVIDVLANDADPGRDIDPTSVTVLAPPQHGLAVVDSDTGVITYTPAAGFSGLDVFTYRVLDATEQGATATVRIDVAPTSFPPDAVDDTTETPEDTSVSIDVAANDTDADGDLEPGSVRILVSPLQGRAEVDPGTGHIVYTPATDFVGRELLLYEIRDARGQSDIGLLHITVTPVNDPPRARDDAAVIAKDTATDLYVLANDTDVDSRLDPATLRVETQPASGTVAIRADGSVRYTPDTGFTGTDTFRYTVADDAGARSNVAIVAITVQAEPTMLVVGRAFEDLDEQGPGLDGPGIAGYVIYLLDGQGQLVATTSTQADDPATQEDETGWYHFPDLASGTYVVAQKRVSLWRQSYPADQGIELAEPPVSPGLYVVTLSREHDMEILDFGNYRSGEAGYASIAGHVYVDVDNDGICDPQEMGLPNVPITIEGPATRVVLTDATGHYRADDLPAGVYTITETQPLVFQDGRDTLGTPRLGTAENDRFVNVPLLPEMALEDYNFGEYGLKVEFIGKRLLLASTPPASQYVANLQVDPGPSLALLELPATGTLRATARSAGESPTIQLYDYQWRPVSLNSRDGELRVRVTGGDAYLVYVDAQWPATVTAVLDTAPPPEPVYVYTHTQRPHDVNADGYVSPRDALVLINALNAAGARPLVGVNLSPYYLDVNHDNYLSPLDALLVINVLNHASGEGEGEWDASVREQALLDYLSDADSAARLFERVLDTLGERPRRGRWTGFTG